MKEREYIDKVKSDMKKDTTEKLFGIPEPPEFLCPRIDDEINVIKQVSNYAQDGIKLFENENEEAFSLFDNINDAVYYGDSNMEDLRSKIEELRNWGEDWKDLFKEVWFKFLKDNEEFKDFYKIIDLE